MDDHTGSSQPPSALEKMEANYTRPSKRYDSTTDDQLVDAREITHVSQNQLLD